MPAVDFRGVGLSAGCHHCGIRSRFQHNKIYTYIGEVLVSVNPYKNLDIYGQQHMAQYRGREMFEVPPHVYAVADACQRVLRQQVTLYLDIFFTVIIA
ncbi:jg2416 [Pararge aegeria aegeria]|uniref:Jg2416 protein n=1 Tax=Pararge aegeria aegeria TaxID=348720 RepID=A0A8S4QQU2_9NEOP|nr:jg2416 [Pararge aegeria aegeria]